MSFYVSWKRIENSKVFNLIINMTIIHIVEGETSGIRLDRKSNFNAMGHAHLLRLHPIPSANAFTKLSKIIYETSINLSGQLMSHGMPHDFIVTPFMQSTKQQSRPLKIPKIISNQKVIINRDKFASVKKINKNSKNNYYQHYVI